MSAKVQTLCQTTKSRLCSQYVCYQLLCQLRIFIYSSVIPVYQRTLVASAPALCYTFFEHCVDELMVDMRVVVGLHGCLVEFKVLARQLVVVCVDVSLLAVAVGEECAVVAGVSVFAPSHITCGLEVHTRRLRRTRGRLCWQSPDGCG